MKPVIAAIFFLAVFLYLPDFGRGNDIEHHPDDPAKDLHKEHEDHLKRMGIHPSNFTNKEKEDPHHVAKKEIVELAKRHLMETQNMTEEEAEKQVTRAGNGILDTEEPGEREEL